jgi:hypothetical protein
MSFSSIFQRLEIAFWIAAIAVMKDRRALRFIPALIISSLCLLSGSLITTSLSHHGQMGVGIKLPVIASAPATATSYPLANGQKNLLVILVDQLESRSPHLEGVWLCVYIPSMPHLTLLPLYPAAFGGTNRSDETLASLFNFEADRKPASAFLEAIRSKGLWWDNTLVLDKIGVAKIVEISGGVDLGTGYINGEQAIARLPAAAESPRPALLGQGVLIRELCRRASSLLINIDPVRTLEQLSSHMVSDFSTDDLESGWYRMRDYGGELNCEFPTLQEIAPTTTP